MFRFTIRGLLWLMVVVGLGVGWYIDKGRVLQAKQAAIKDARTLLTYLTDPFAGPILEQERKSFLAAYFPGEDTTNWTGPFTDAKSIKELSKHNDHLIKQTEEQQKWIDELRAELRQFRKVGTAP